MSQFGEKIEICKTNSPLYVKCNIYCGMTTAELCRKAERSGFLLIPAGENEDFAQIAFSVSAVGSGHFEKAVKTLKKLADSGE